jgi:hypothetical protein
VTDRDKHSSLLQYENNYDCKKVYETQCVIAREAKLPKPHYYFLFPSKADCNFGKYKKVLNEVSDLDLRP